MSFADRITLRRGRVRKLTEGSLPDISELTSPDVIYSILIWIFFVLAAVPIIGYELIKQGNPGRLAALALIIIFICLTIALHISLYQKRLIAAPSKILGLAIMFLLFLLITKVAVKLTGHSFWSVAASVAVSAILTIVYSQRFATPMVFFYCILACFGSDNLADINRLLTMLAAALPFCFFLRDIRTRMKLLEVSLIAAVSVLLLSAAMSYLFAKKWSVEIFRFAGPDALIALVVGILIQGLLPVLEKVFHIATSMTLLDYSDANQPLLKRLAIEAPGTFSHSLLIGSIAEAAAEAINRNGLLCRVGAYYHDIGKINKSGYFVENQLGTISWHKELSPQMSQLIIVGHIKDGLELAEEYGLPAVLRQFIETHHGTTLVEYFYDRAVKQQEAKDAPPPSQGEFRYPGPKPRTKEAAIVMLADAVESAVRSLSEATPTKIEAVVHNMAMKRLQDGQFDECDLSLRELSLIENSMSKSLAAHHHIRIAYPKPPEMPYEQSQ